MKRIYLDYAATTPVLPEVAEAMLPWIQSGYGNPSSLHAEGRASKDAIDESRESLSHYLGCLFAEVLFTGSGTEAANLAILGSAFWALENKPSRRRILFPASEHHCVLHTAPLLKRFGFQVEILPVDRYARIDLNALRDTLGDDVLLVSCMHANNELGTWQPVAEVATLCRQHGVRFHCDAVQTLRQVGNLAEIADLATFSAHKIGGPKGVGAIYLRAGVKVTPLVVGGAQEREVRGGTENVAGIVGFGAAIRTQPTGSARPARDHLRARLLSAGAIASVPEDIPCLDGHLHVRFPGRSAESLLIRLDREGIAASAGAACSSGSLEPSHVLLACGYSVSEAKEGVRLTLGPATSVAEAEEAAARIVNCLS